MAENEEAPAKGPSRAIEVAKTGRATCRTCRKGIPKGDLRYGDQQPNAFSDAGGMMWRWHHLACAAQKTPHEVREALASFDGEIPDRDALEATLSTAEKKVRPKPPFPFAERAPTARSHCQGCHATIEKGELRIAIERPMEAQMATGAASYLHPRCALAHLEEPDLAERVKANSAKVLPPDELEQVIAEIGA